MFVSIMGFHAKISDPLIGGTYMTLLNTISNLGGNWPNTLALWSVDGLTWKSCFGALEGMTCGTAAQAKVYYLNSFYTALYQVVLDTQGVHSAYLQTRISGVGYF